MTDGQKSLKQLKTTNNEMNNELQITGPAEVKLQVFQSQMVRAATEAQVKAALLPVIGKAFMRLGQNITDKKNEIAFLATDLSAEVKKRYPNILLTELEAAVTNGILGEYGEFFGLNVVSVLKFIKAYFESEERRKKVTDFYKSIEPPAALPPSPEAQKKATDDLILAAFEKFKKDGYYEDYGNFIYLKLDERGLVNLTAERKTQILQEARAALIAEYSQRSPDPFERKKTERSLKAIFENTDDAEVTIINKARKIALQTVFEQYKSLEVDLAEFLIENE